MKTPAPIIRAAMAAVVAMSIAAPAAPADTTRAAPTAEEPPQQDGGLPLMDEIERAARDAMRRLGDEFAPLMRQLGEMIDELDAYEAPRRLPNGDILIPRKRAPKTPPDQSEPETLDL